MPTGWEVLNDVYDSTNHALKTNAAAGGATSTPTSIGDGLKAVTTAGTAEALAGSTACKSVTITAKSGNTGTVVVGGSTVVAAVGATRRGTPLAANQSMSLDISNLSLIFLDVTVSGEAVSYTYVN